MKNHKAMEILNKAEWELHRLYVDAERQGLTHIQLLELKKSRLAFAYEKTPRWLQSAVHAMDSLLFHRLYWWPEPKLKFCHVWQEKLYDSWDELPEEAKEFVRKGGNLISNHYWIKTNKIWSV